MDKEIYNKIKQAHERLLQHNLEKPEESSIATELIQKFHSYIENYNGNAIDINIEEYVLGNSADKFASSGQAISTQPGFKKFLADIETKNIIDKLFTIRKTANKFDSQLLGKIESCGFHGCINRYFNNYDAGKTPRVYTNRVVLMIFPEIFTAIANNKDMNDTANELEIDTKHSQISFVRLQYQIRDKVNDYLKEAGLYGKTSIVNQATIAWYILEK